MIYTSKGLLDTFIYNNDEILDEEFDLDSELDKIINEDCGEITIGSWAFLEEESINDEVRFKILDEVLNGIESEILETESLIETLEIENDENIEFLDEAVATTVKRIAKIASKKPIVAAKVAAKRTVYVAKKAGKAALDKLKVASKEALMKSREYAGKARELAAAGSKAASDKAKAMASKLAQKAKDLKNKLMDAIRNFQSKKELATTK